MNLISRKITQSAFLQERKELEQALTQQRESATFMKEKLRQEHEEEISALMDENTKLEDELAEVKRQVCYLFMYFSVCL